MTNVNVHRLSSELQLQENAELKRHLENCPKCEAEYEEMLHAAAVLENLPEPAPPPDLAVRIQKQITKEHHRSRLAFFANPFARLLLALKLNPHPALVNCTAMMFYLMLTVFLVKLTFFSEPDDSRHVLAPTKSVRQNARVVTTSWAAIRGIPSPRKETEPATPKEETGRER
jgi:hypothetical protein